MNKEPYSLTAEEKQVLLDINKAAGQRKLAVYDLNMQLERAQRERDATEQLFAGALAMIANPRGLAGGTLTPDFTRILPPGQSQ
jgi:hypothetical protein